MSHRITTKTKIMDLEIAKNALEKKGWQFEQSGQSLHIKSGPMNRASINLTSGEVIGDTDWHKKDALESLNQAYGEALYEKEIAEQGGYVEERQELQNGDVRLVVNVSFA